MYTLQASNQHVNVEGVNSGLYVEGGRRSGPVAVVSRLYTACSTCFGMSSGSVEYAAYSLVKMLLMHMLQLGAAVNRVAVHSWQVTFHMQSSLDLKPRSQA